MEAAGTLRRQHRPCRGLRSFQMTRWQRPNEQQRGCNAASLSLAENRVGALPAAGAVTTNAPGLELLLVGNTSIGEDQNFVDCHLSLQSIEDVLPPPVLH